MQVGWTGSIHLFSPARLSPPPLIGRGLWWWSQALSIYLDVINLFIFILSILGENR